MGFSEGSQRFSIRSDVIFLTHFNPVVTQDGVGRGGVKEEMGQTVVEQVRLAGETLFLGGSGLRDDFPS